MYARLRPKRSPILLPIRMNAAETRASRAIAAWMALTSMPRSSTTAEIETFMIDVSTTSTNIAIARRIGSARLGAGAAGACASTAAVMSGPSFGPRGLQDWTSSRRLPPAFGRRPDRSARIVRRGRGARSAFGIRVAALRPSPSVRYPRSDNPPAPLRRAVRSKTEHSMIATPAPKLIRQDGRDKVTGSGRYAADLTMTGMLHGAFRIADVSHARIRRIDTTAARALPGVHAVITAADVPEVRYGAFLKDRTLFARDVVRWEGELIAAVAAATPEIAAQAAALIDIDLEPLPALTDLEAAVAPGCPARPRRLGDLRDRREPRPRRATSRHARRSSRATPRPPWPARTSSSRAATSPTARTPSRSSRGRSSPSGRATTSRSGRRRRSRSRSGPASPRRSACRRTGSGSSCPHLGGGFGAKCELGFEPQVAALALAAGRPGQGRLLAARGVPAARPSPRADDHGARDRCPDGRDDRGPPAGT